MWIFFPFLLVQQKQKSTSSTNFSAIKTISNRAATRDTTSVFIFVHCCLLSHWCAEIEPYRKVSNGAASHTFSMGAKNTAFSHTDRTWLGELFLKNDLDEAATGQRSHWDYCCAAICLSVCSRYSSLLFRSHLKNSMKEKP